MPDRLVRTPRASAPTSARPAGYGSGLFNADALAYDRPAVLVEGEVDALTIAQACGTEVAAWWLQRLPCARRLRPLDHDVNSLPEVETVRAWLALALARD